MNNEIKSILSDLELVHRQLHCVKHLCEAVASVADCHIRTLLVQASMTGGHESIKIQGMWSNAFMQWVGEFLNGMDAVDDDDHKWDATFRQASERWKNFSEEKASAPPTT